MNSFKRTGNSNVSLGVGMVHVYKEMWNKKMPKWYDSINNWAQGENINYAWGIMDFETGMYNFYSLDFEDQNPTITFSISLEDLLESLKERKKYEDEILMRKLMTERETQKAHDKMRAAAAEHAKEFKKSTFPYITP